MSLFKGIFKYVWPQIRKYRISFFTLFVLFGIRVLLGDIFRPIYFKKIVDTLSLSIDRVSSAEKILYLVSIIILINIILTIVSRTGKMLIYSFEIKVIKNLRDYAFEKISMQSHVFFANTFSGSLVTKSRRFVGAFEIMFDIFIYSFYGTLITFIGMFFSIYQQSSRVAYIFLFVVVIYIFIIFLFIKRKIKYDELEAKSDSKIGGYLADVFGNILALKIFSSRNREVKSFDNITEEAASRSKDSWFFAGKIEITQAIFQVIIFGGTLYLSVKLWLDGIISTGTVVLIQTYISILVDRLWDMNNTLMRFMKHAADMKEVIDIFEMVPEIQDPKIPERLSMSEGNIIFKEVSFKYQNGQEVLSNFNLNIKPGERIGLVGHSGAGKSTLTNLILRFTDVTEGSITIDSQDVRNVTQDDLRSVISYVPQESILFHRSIRENIAYGKPDATDEEIIAVAKKAHAHEFIEKLPRCYDTLVGERGVKLSGGERQRVAIARAMLKDAPILILDEATSSLDSVSEKYIQESFEKLMEGRTTIVIAHRLSTIQKMDRIIVLDHGEIVEEGTHKELLKKEGVYADLWNHQVGGFIE